MKFQVVVISGGTGVGKNTFIRLCRERVDYSLDISTIDFVKQIQGVFESLIHIEILIVGQSSGKINAFFF